MGCCQNSNSSFEEQITLDTHPKHESLMTSLRLPSSPSQNFENFIIYASQEENISFYTVSSLISSSLSFKRFQCTQSPSQTQQELLLLKRKHFKSEFIESLETKCETLYNFPHENLVRLRYWQVSEKSIQIFTEFCGQKSLGSILESNKIPFLPALTFSKQILQGLIHLQKLGLSGKYLTEHDVFLVKDSLKISFSAMIKKPADLFPGDFEEIPNPEVFSFGIILLKLLTAPHRFLNIEEGLARLVSAKVDSQDIENLKKMLKIWKKRPSLLEVSQYSWNTCANSSFYSKEYKKKSIEKISEEVSGSLVESCDFDLGDCQECLEGISKIEKSIVLQTMESLII